jgi:recombination protein RecR
MDAPSGPIERLAAAFGKLPGIGPKSAERMTHALLADDRATAVELAEALRAIVEQVHPCRECFNLTDGAICSICAEVRSDVATICVVETPRDLSAMERIGSFKGKYHVLGGRLAPLDNFGPEKLTADALLRRNLLIWGLGGVIVPFIGIKLLDVVLVGMHIIA